MVDHCVFHGVKQSVVYWTPGSSGHALRNCLIYGCKAGVWTSGIANDFDYQNNVVSNCAFVWIGQGARSVQAELAQIAGGGRPAEPGQGGPPAGGPPAGGPPGGGPGRPPEGPVAPESRYKVKNSLFAGNKKLTGSGAGPALNFRDTDGSLLTLIDTKTTEQTVQLELDQEKRNYLHPVAGSDAAQVGAGLFTKSPA